MTVKNRGSFVFRGDNGFVVVCVVCVVYVLMY